MKFILVFLPIFFLVGCVITGVFAARTDSYWLGFLCFGLFLNTWILIENVISILPKLIDTEKK
jgi:hypothetical protein